MSVSESFIDSVLLYGAEVWGCMRGIDGVEQLQLRALRSFLGVCRSHPKASLLSEIYIMPIVWMPRVRCIVFFLIQGIYDRSIPSLRPGGEASCP